MYMDDVVFFFILIGIVGIFAVIATIGSIIRYHKNRDEDEIRSAYYGIGCFAIGVFIALSMFLNKTMGMK